MPTTPTPRQPWTQMGLGPPDVIEVTLRIGIVLSTEHGQLELEVRNAETQELYSLESVPHSAFSDMGGHLRNYQDAVTDMVWRWTGPFADRSTVIPG
jgi:hypothetical protein